MCRQPSLLDNEPAQFLQRYIAAKEMLLGEPQIFITLLKIFLSFKRPIVKLLGLAGVFWPSF